VRSLILDQELHGLIAIWFVPILMATVAIVFSINRPPANRRDWIITLCTYLQLLIPWGLAWLLESTGADHEGGFAESRLQLSLSAALVLIPLLCGIYISMISRGRRVPAILMSVVSAMTGAMLLLGFMMIGC
jgi:hypothetical protein